LSRGNEKTFRQPFEIREYQGSINFHSLRNSCPRRNLNGWICSGLYRRWQRKKPEYEDCKRIAFEKKIPIHDVYQEALNKGSLIVKKWRSISEFESISWKKNLGYAELHTGEERGKTKIGEGFMPCKIYT
jgi:hypothetical protein